MKKMTCRVVLVLLALSATAYAGPKKSPAVRDDVKKTSSLGSCTAFCGEEKPQALSRVEAAASVDLASVESVKSEEPAAVGVEQPEESPCVEVAALEPTKSGENTSVRIERQPATNPRVDGTPVEPARSEEHVPVHVKEPTSSQPPSSSRMDVASVEPVKSEKSAPVRVEQQPAAIPRVSNVAVVSFGKGEEAFSEQEDVSDGTWCEDGASCACVKEDESGRFTFVGTVLYLAPNIDDSHYVLTSFDNTFGGSLFPNGKRHQNTPPFTPGYTVEGIYALCPERSALGVNFTYFDARAITSTGGNFLYDTNGFPGFGAQDNPVYAGVARSRNFYRLYSNDFVYYRLFPSCCPENFTCIFGLHDAYVKFDEHTLSTGTFQDQQQVTHPLDNHLHRKSRFFGVGPQLGVDYRYVLCSPSELGSLAIDLRAQGMLLCGYTRSALTYVTLRTGPGGVAVINGDTWRVVPATKAQMGLSYALDCAGCDIAVDLGYDFMWYSNCISRTTGLEIGFAGDSIDIFSSLSLHGPYLRVSVSF